MTVFLLLVSRLHLVKSRQINFHFKSLPLHQNKLSKKVRMSLFYISGAAFYSANLSTLLFSTQLNNLGP